MGTGGAQTGQNQGSSLSMSSLVSPPQAWWKARGHESQHTRMPPWSQPLQWSSLASDAETGAVRATAGGSAGLVGLGDGEVQLGHTKGELSLPLVLTAASTQIRWNLCCHVMRRGRVGLKGGGGGGSVEGREGGLGVVGQTNLMAACACQVGAGQ